MMNSLDLNSHNLKIVTWSDIMQMDNSMKPFEDWTGKDIAEEFNRRCEMGAELVYIEDSMWEFEDIEAAREVMEAIDAQDAKRVSD